MPRPTPGWLIDRSGWPGRLVAGPSPLFPSPASLRGRAVAGLSSPCHRLGANQSARDTRAPCNTGPVLTTLLRRDKRQAGGNSAGGPEPGDDGGGMSRARSLPAPLRRAGQALVHLTAEWIRDLGAIGPDDRQGRSFGAFGAGSCLAFPQGSIFNQHYIAIGRHTIVGPHASLSAGMGPGQDMPTNPVVRIGDRCLIGRGSHIVGHWRIEIGDDIQTGPYVYITDQNHSYDDPDLPVGRQWPVEAEVKIGSGSWLGAHAVILPGATLGRNVVVAAGAVVRGEIPDHSVVAGVPGRIVRRWTPASGWTDADKASIAER